MNAGNKKRAQRAQSTKTECDYLNGWINELSHAQTSHQNDEPQRSSWGLFVGCLMSQQHTSVSQGRICSDNFTCCHTEIEAADQTFYLTQSQYTDTGPTSPSADPITPGAWQGGHWYDSTPKKFRLQRDSNPGSSALEADALPLGQRGSSSWGRQKKKKKDVLVLCV